MQRAYLTLADVKPAIIYFNQNILGLSFSVDAAQEE